MESTAFSEHRRDAVTESLKVPPHSIEAEQAVLGGLMLDNEAWLLTAERLRPADFYRADHRLIYSAVEALANDNKPCDVVTLAETLEYRGELEAAGGLAFLASLAENTPSAANIAAYAEIVRERSVLRQLIRAGTDIGNSAFNPEGRNTDELLDGAERLVFEIADQRSRGRSGVRAIKDLLVSALDRIDTLYQQDNPITGVATGFYELDGKTAGLQRSDLIIIAGRPSMGKTALAINFAQEAAIKSRLPVVIFSMEMQSEQLVLRMLSSLGRIDQHKMRTGKLEDDDWPRLTSAVTLLQDAKIFIDDTPSLTPGDLRARCRRLAREHGIGLIVVDYLQLMHVPGTKENRATEISEISRSLKSLAKELNVPLIALSQLNRHLRASGAIEQDADLIIFIYRDEVYNDASEHKGTAEVNIGKQRNGPTGKVRLKFFGEYTLFENLAAEEYERFGDYE